MGTLATLQPSGSASGISNSRSSARRTTIADRRMIDKEPRLRGAIQVTQEDPQAAVREIERRASIAASSRSACRRARKSARRSRYWPIYEACERNNLPLGLHVPGFGSGYASTPGGWPTFYLEEHQTFAYVIWRVHEHGSRGVFERYPS